MINSLTFEFFVVKESVRIVDNLASKSVKLTELCSMSVDVVLDEIVASWALGAFVVRAVVEVVFFALIAAHSHHAVSTLAMARMNIALGRQGAVLVAIACDASFRRMAPVVCQTLVTSRSSYSRFALALARKYIAFSRNGT